MPGKRHIHSAKFRRCVKEVAAKGMGYNPYAVCMTSIGYKGSMMPEGQKIHGMPLVAIEKMVKNPKTPKRLKAFWQKQLKKVV